MLVTSGLLLALLAVIGVCSAPSNWDSMTYHLVRVMHWMQNRSVVHYPTGDPTQLYHGPLAEFAILHLQVLTGGDRFAFAVAWLSFVVAIIGASLLAKLLGASIRGQVLSAIFALTLPGGLLQAVSTQNNLAVGMWLVIAMVALIEFQQAGRSAAYLTPPVWATAFGSAIGLALLTKGTAYIFAIPLVAWFAAVGVRTRIPRGRLLVCMAALIVVALNLGPCWRNYGKFGSPLLPTTDRALFRTGEVIPRLVTANLINNVVLDLRTGRQPLDRLICNVALGLQNGIGIRGADARIVLPGHSMARIPSGNSEDVVGCPIHFLILVLAIGLAIASAGAVSGRRGECWLALSLVFSYVLFAALVRWQMFHARLHLPLFILGAPLAGLLLERLRRRIAVTALMSGLLVLGFCLTINNPGHPMRGPSSIFHRPREAQYFAMRRGLYRPYLRACDLLAAHGCSEVGISSGHAWEYPLWVMLRSREGRWPIIDSTPRSDLTTAPTAMCAFVAIPLEARSDATTLPTSTWHETDCGRRVKVLLRLLSNE